MAFNVGNSDKTGNFIGQEKKNLLCLKKEFEKKRKPL